MPRRTAQVAEQTRESLITAGRALFSENGFDAVSMEDIATRASVTRGALYHHFGGKEALFREVTERLLEELGLLILERASEGSDPWDALERGCSAFLEGSQRREYSRIVLIDAPAVLGIATWQALDDRHTTSTLRSALREIAATDNGPDNDPDNAPEGGPDIEAIAEALSGAMNQLSLWASTRESTDRQPAVQPPAVRRAQATVSRLLTVLIGRRPA